MKIDSLAFNGCRRTGATARLRVCLMLMLCCSLLASAGCGAGTRHPKTVRVSGTVSYKGQPVTSGEVRFHPVDDAAGRVAIGRIMPDGAYEASTFERGDGVIAGEYRITVMSFTFDEKTPQKDRDLGIGSEPAIPEKYFSVEDSGLKETITEPRVITLNLVD